jgi:hypothetical protein
VERQLLVDLALDSTTLNKAAQPLHGDHPA